MLCTYLKKFKDILQQIFKFYQNSAVRMAGLKEIEVSKKLDEITGKIGCVLGSNLCMVIVIKLLVNKFLNTACYFFIDNFRRTENKDERSRRDTRWLSHDRAVSAVGQCLPALITSLEREASERSGATAAGLSIFVKNPNFIASIYMMSDVLPHLSRLSKSFQVQSCKQVYI